MEDHEIKSWYYEKRAEPLIKNLKERQMNAQFTATAEKGRDAVLALIPEGASVILTGTQTLEQIGVKPHLRQSDKYDLIDPYEPGIEREEGIARRKRGLTADVMVSGTNALTEDGILVNVDGQGNRVAGMIFGPDKVIVATGMNKVVKDIPAAMERLREVPRPVNNKRLGLPNPCNESGFCSECSSPSRICNYFTIIERSLDPNRFHVVLIGQDLGY
jgi:L-lactate utilization protein LutB